MIIKILTVLAPMLLAFTATYGQSKQLMSDKAFSKMMVDHYNYVLIGSLTPTTGFKVETSKPSVTLKGNIISSNNKSFVTNLELEGGLENGVMNLVNGDDVNTYFKGSLGFNFLLPYNVASFYKASAAESKLFDNSFYINKVFISTQVDTFLVLNTIVKDSLFLNYTFDQLKDTVILNRKKSKFKLDDFTREYYKPNEDEYFTKLIREILIKYGAKISKDNKLVLKDFTSKLGTIDEKFKLGNIDEKLKYKQLLKDHNRLTNSLLKTKNTLNDKQYDFEIEITKEKWTWKAISWINFSLVASNSNFKIYNPNENMLLDESSFLPGVSLSYNLLWKGKNSSQFQYYRGGVLVAKTNSLTDLSDFSYEKVTVIEVSPSEELKDKKEGTAYQGQLIEKVGYDIFIEGYIVPWRQNFIPGMHLKAVYRTSKAWINQNKVSLDLGMVWSVVSNDKDAKNLLTIVPYVTWENLKTEYTDAAKTEEKPLSDLFSFHVKLGIPINIGK